MGEVDIIARDGSTLVFVEVKARFSSRYGTPADAITGRKRSRLVRMAEEFLLQSRLTRVPCRFDVVAVQQLSQGPPSVEVFPAAFRADDAC